MGDDREQVDREADRNVEDLEQSSEKLENAIRETKRDWEAKQSSDSVAGAVDPDEDRPDKPDS